MTGQSLLTSAPSEVFSRTRNRNSFDLLAEISAEVPDISRQQLSGVSFNGRERDWHVFLWQGNSMWKLPWTRLKQMKHSRQLGEAHSLIFIGQVDPRFL